MSTRVVALSLGGAVIVSVIVGVLFQGSDSAHDAGSTPSGDAEAVSAERVEALEREVAELKSEIGGLRALLEATLNQPRAAASGDAGAADGEPDAALRRATPEDLARLEDRLARMETDTIVKITRGQAALRFREGMDGDVVEAAATELLAMVRKGDKEALEVFTDALQSDHDGLRSEALRALAELGDSTYLPYFVQGTKDESSHVREVAARALHRMPADQAGPVLMGMLADEDEDVIQQAVYSLTNLEYVRAAPELQRLARHKDLSLAVDAARALMHLGDRSAVPVVMPRLVERLRTQDAGDRRRALRYMRRFRVQEARPYFQQALQDASERVRREAEKGLRELDRKK